MNPFAMALVICSTFMHAGWNLLARRQKSEIAFFNRMLALTALIGFVPAVLSEALTHSLTIKAWMCVAGSGFCCGLYFFYLARAYESSDFTGVYPVVRALPVILVGIGDVMRRRYPTALGWLGMLMVVAGCFFVPLHSIRDFTMRRYFNRTNLWVFFAALGTVGYTLLDKVSSEVVQQGPATAARYGYIFILIAYMVYSVLLRTFKAGEHPGSIGWKIPAFAACLNFGAYWLVLWAYQLSLRASYITAFRQFSIIIGVVLAFVIYKEKGLGIRLAGTFVITSGLILIGLWGS